MAGATEDALPETVALRFRDFGVDTIAEHNAIAEEHGTVWWGWWRKPAEKIPVSVLAHFERKIQTDGSLDVFLVDSGHERLFRARLVEISAAPGLQEDRRMAPPEPERVPSYYRNREWPVWLRFDGPIDEIDEAALRDFSYEELADDVFVEDPSIESYSGKRVHDLREMLGRRHRTMYFLRPYRAGDREGEIQLVAPDHPRPFSTTAYPAREDYVLFLSDLHFSADRDHHGYRLVSEAGDPDLLQVLDEDRDSNFEGRAPAAVVIAGDLTWTGTPEEFEYARSFVSRLRSIWGLDWSQILIVPGNHDITWGAPGEAGAPVDPEAERAYRDFISQTLRFTPPEQLSIGRRFLLGNYVPIDIVAVNSVRLERDEYRGYGFVGADQLREAFEAMGWSRGAEPGPKLRVLVLHHHVVPVVPLEELGAERYSLTLDAGELLYMALEYGVDLVVHGHQHKPFAAGFSRMVSGAPVSNRLLAIHGLGSVGVAASHIPSAESNAYTVLRVRSDGASLEVRTRSPQHGHAFRKAWGIELDRTPHGLRAREPAE